MTDYETPHRVSRSVRKAADVWCDQSITDAEQEGVMSAYRTSILKKVVFILVCVVAAFVVAGLSLGIGAYDIGFFECYQIVWDHIFGTVDDTLRDYIVVEKRLPRIVLGLVSGAGLAVCGCLMQSMLKNPLADPYTTGISSGAGFGATMAITAGLSLVGGQYSIVVNAFVFALIPMAVIIMVSKLKGASPTTMIMAGIAVMYIFNAFSTVMKLMADPDALSQLYSWQVGTLGDASWTEIPLVFAVVLAGSVFIQLFATKINILATGDDNAKAMGVNVENLRIILLMVSTFVVASIVSFTGLIGFVGMVSPHVARMFVGSDNRFLIPASIMFGASLMLVADTIGRVVIAPAVLEVGVITAFIGGPLFLYLVLSRKKSVW